jgi:hypothetical protein
VPFWLVIHHVFVSGLEHRRCRDCVCLWRRFVAFYAVELPFVQLHVLGVAVVTQPLHSDCRSRDDPCRLLSFGFWGHCYEFK